MDTQLTQVQRIRLNTIVFATRQYIAKRRRGWFGPAAERRK